ncbi:MAG: DUF502 domain-containing protein [Methylotenera sp.]|nr:DUF502 domain-containing protein [Methylotenera sp.]MDO9233310.1 DUF502 domain-containing protein [Methylotenera sp.]MDO9388367.1 DUF502 domain-containing protein [Methylotenera sp.]MDP2403038.1 DUF502 domain-containing protein [Methylotenera sp.]MDP3096081.1 DUF502 domain-containing protein [Methylotenera sp.]
MLRSINKIILTGLITTLPVILTLYILYWFILATESFLGGAIRAVLPEELYRPGMGVIAGLVVAFLIGLLMQSSIAQQFFSRIERIVYRLPLIKSVYLSIRDLLDYFSSEKKKDFEQVVAITFGDAGMQVVGLVTQTDMNHMPAGFNQQDSLLVYIPMSYGIGGFAVLVPRSATRPLDMSMEDAMRFTLTAGVTGDPKLENNEK